MNTKLFLATTGNGIAPALPYGDGEWSIELPLTEQDVRCLASDPLNADVIYAGTGVTASCARMIVVKPGSVVAWMVKSSKSHRLDCSFHSADCAVPPRNGISGDLLKLPVDFRHADAILIKSKLSTVIHGTLRATFRGKRKGCEHAKNHLPNPADSNGIHADSL